MGCGSGKTNIGSPEAKEAWAAQSALVEKGWSRNDDGMYVSPDGGQELSPIQVNKGAGKGGKK